MTESLLPPELKILLLIGLSFGLMIGIIKKQKVIRSIVLMAFGPVLFMFFRGEIQILWSTLDASGKLVMAIVIIFAILLILAQTPIGQNVIGNWIADTVTGLFGLLFGMIGFVFKTIANFIVSKLKRPPYLP